MTDTYVVRGGKLITVGQNRTIEDGALVVEDGKIIEVGKWCNIRQKHSKLEVIDYSNHTITPSLVDCHTHLLEFAPTSLYPITIDTHFLAGKAILLHALTSGITALGEQICGHPNSNFSIDDYRNVVNDFPLDISFAATSISIGFKELAHFTSITKSMAVHQKDLSHDQLVKQMAQQTDYPGENLFINATPANFKLVDVPRAGEIMYSQKELNSIVDIFHQTCKKIGVHVGGETGINMALDAGVDVLHHAHGITDSQMDRVKRQDTKIIATPIGGTHLRPNSPENIVKLLEKDIHVSIATDAYLPPSQEAEWLPFQDQALKGPEVFMKISHPAMKLLHENEYNENDILALITANPATILNKGNRFGKLESGMDANFLVAEGIPGLEITDISGIKKIYFRGRKVIEKL